MNAEMEMVYERLNRLTTRVRNLEKSPPIPPRLAIASRLLAGEAAKYGVSTIGPKERTWALEEADALLAAHAETEGE